MTFKEKFVKEVRTYLGRNIEDYNKFCPNDFGYEIKNKDCNKINCTECWNREIPEEKENTTKNLCTHTEQFICSKCELHLEDFTQQIYDEDEDETYSVEFEFLYCPGCGRKVE